MSEESEAGFTPAERSGGASAPERRDTERLRLGALARERHLITGAQLEAALARRGEGPLGEALVELGFLTPAQVSALLRLQRLRREAAARPAGPDPLVGTTLGGCQVLAVAGRGFSGTTYRARHPRLERDVALKVLDPALVQDALVRERFLQEARALSRLDHPALLAIHDAGEDQGRLWLVLQFVEGRSLEELLAAEGPLPVEAALRLGLALARGLRAAHAAGVVHRDVKAQNVLVGWDGAVKLADFGLALVLDHPLDGSELAGTPVCMAPEQFLGEGLGPAVDQYGLGALLYQALTGRHLYPGNDLLTVARQHVSAPLPDLPGPAPVQALLRRLLAKKPARRFADMSEAARALGRALRELGSEADDPSGELPPLAEAAPAASGREEREEREGPGQQEALVLSALLGDLAGLFAALEHLPAEEGTRLGERVLGALERAARPALLDQALRELPGWRRRWPRAPLLVARALRRAGRARDALLALELAPDPDHPDALTERAAALRACGRGEETRGLLQRSSKNPRPEVVRRAGELWLELLDEPREAAGAFGRLAELVPTAAEPREQEAMLLLEAGRPAEARAALEDAVRRAPAAPHAWTLLGWACERLGDAPAARDAYERVLALDPAAEGVKKSLARLGSGEP